MYLRWSWAHLSVSWASLVCIMAADQLFIGRLPRTCRNRDLEDIFYKYGRMTRCDVKQGEKGIVGYM